MMANNDGKSSKRENRFLSHTFQVLRDPVWQFVSTLIGVIGIFATYHVISLQHDTKALQVMTLARTSLVEVEQSVAEEITILYRDQIIADLSLFQVKVENSGTQTIREEDYARPIKFVFPPQAEIVGAAILESSPPNIEMTVQTEQNTATLSPVLLNEEDRAIIRFLVSNMPSNGGLQPFIVDARIAGVKELYTLNALEEEETENDASVALAWGGGGVTGFGIGFLMAGFLGFVAQQLRFERHQGRGCGSVLASRRFVMWATVLVGLSSGFVWLAFKLFLSL